MEVKMPPTTRFPAWTSPLGTTAIVRTDLLGVALSAVSVSVVRSIPAIRIRRWLVPLESVIRSNWPPMYAPHARRWTHSDRCKRRSRGDSDESRYARSEEHMTAKALPEATGGGRGAHGAPF